MAAVSSLPIISYDSLSANLSKDKKFHLPVISDRIGSILQTALAQAQNDSKEKLEFPANMEDRFTLIHEAKSTVMKQRVYAIVALVLGAAAICALILLIPVCPVHLIFTAYASLLLPGVAVVSAPILLIKASDSQKIFEIEKRKFDKYLQNLETIIKTYGSSIEKILPTLISSSGYQPVTAQEAAAANAVLNDWRNIMKLPA